MALKRFTVEALNTPLGEPGVFHLREGEFVMRKLAQHGWVLDEVKATLDEGFVCSTHEVIPWSEQGVNVMKVTWAEEEKAHE